MGCFVSWPSEVSLQIDWTHQWSAWWLTVHLCWLARVQYAVTRLHQGIWSIHFEAFFANPGIWSQNHGLFLCGLWPRQQHASCMTALIALKTPQSHWSLLAHRLAPGHIQEPSEFLFARLDHPQFECLEPLNLGPIELKWPEHLLSRSLSQCAIKNLPTSRRRLCFALYYWYYARWALVA